MTTTVVLPTYNRADVLPRAIESVLGQTTGDFELVIVDDASTDHTRDVVTEYLSTDDRIRYAAHRTNRGVAAARNTGIETATSEYISLLDSDDELKPSFIEKSIRTLRTLPPCCAGVYVTLECRKEGRSDGLYEAVPLLPVADSIGTEAISAARTGGMTVRKNAITEVGPFDVRFERVSDTEYWVRLLQSYQLVGIEEPLYIYHTSDDQKTKRIGPQIEGTELFLSKHREVLTSEARAEWLHHLAELYVENGEFSKAARTFSEATNYEPRLSAYSLSLALQISPRLYEPIDRMWEFGRRIETAIIDSR